MQLHLYSCAALHIALVSGALMFTKGPDKELFNTAQNGQKQKKKKDLCTLPCGFLGRCSEARPGARGTCHPQTETWAQWARYLQEES